MLKLEYTQYINNFEKGPIRRSLFSNGAVSLFHKANGFSGAKVQLHFIAGSMFEKENQEGLSHLIEHMIFKEVGTKYIEILEKEGAIVNAYTYKENVCFEMSCLSNHLDKLLPLFLEKFTLLDFSDESLEKEKTIILHELGDELDDHETQAVEYAFLKNFDQSLGHPIGGNPRQVKKYKRKDLEAFYKKYYSPNRLILSVVSGKDNKKIEKYLNDVMSKRYKEENQEPFRLKSANKISNLTHFKKSIKKKIENAVLLYSFNGPSMNSQRYYDFAVLDEVFFEGLNSVFFKKLREENPLVYGYGSSVNSFKSCGNYLMMFNTRMAEVPKIKKIILNSLIQYSNELLDEEAVHIAKKKILDHWELSFDDLDERVEFMAGSEIYQLDEFSIEQIKMKIKSVTPVSVRNVLKKITQANFSELIIKPH